MQVQYAKQLKRSAYTYAHTYYTYYRIYGRKLYKMVIVPCAYLTRLSLGNTLKGGLKLQYIISFVQNNTMSHTGSIGSKLKRSVYMHVHCVTISLVAFI